jgi:hypothetical protein
MFHQSSVAIVFSTAPGSYRAGQARENRCCAALTGIAARLRYLHAPPEKAAVLFSLPGLRGDRANARIVAG